jgi:hypothetical protein
LEFRQLIGAPLVVVLLLFETIAAFMFSTWRRDRVAASLFVPYAAWVRIRLILNASIFILNYRDAHRADGQEEASARRHASDFARLDQSWRSRG